MTWCWTHHHKVLKKIMKPVMEPVMEALKVAKSQIRSHPCWSNWIKKDKLICTLQDRVTDSEVRLNDQEKQGRWGSITVFGVPEDTSGSVDVKVLLQQPSESQASSRSRGTRGGSPCWQTPRRMTWNPQWPLRLLTLALTVLVKICQQMNKGQGLR